MSDTIKRIEYNESISSPLCHKFIFDNDINDHGEDKLFSKRFPTKMHFPMRLPLSQTCEILLAGFNLQKA